MIDSVALLALAIDAVVGWPQAVYRRFGHPVGAFAWVIETLEGRWNSPAHSSAAKRAGGIATVLILIGGAGGMAWALQAMLVAGLGVWSWPVMAVLAAPALAQRSLYDHVAPIANALDAENLPAARNAVGLIVGRDTAQLDRSGISRAAIESLSESFCDGIAAPFFWLLVLGLPGVWIYKAVNTADSMIGHREPRWRAFGWAAARTDDVLNLIPARLAAMLICLCGGRGWTIMWRDAAKHASPNAGWPEAAMAGALRLKLGGPISYEGLISHKLWIGEGSPDAGPADIRRSLTIYSRACACLWLIAGVLAWAL